MFAWDCLAPLQSTCLKIRVTLFPFASDFVSFLSLSISLSLSLLVWPSLSKLNTSNHLQILSALCPTSNSPINTFIRIRSHCVLAEVQGDLQAVHALNGQKQGDPAHLPQSVSPLPCLWPVYRRAERLNGVSFPHHPAHKTMPGMQ